MKGDIVVTDGGISVIDYAGDAGTMCDCGEDAMFSLIIFDKKIDVCTKCLTRIIHCAVDALE